MPDHLIEPPAPAPRFEESARRVLQRVRSAYADLLAALGSPARAADVQSALRLDKKLAWRLHRLADALDPLESAAFVPSRVSANRVVRAAADAGVPDAVGEAVLEVTDAFHAFVAERAEDRAAFDAMVAAVAGQGLEPILHDAQRSAFRANVVLHGKFSELMAQLSGFAPGPDADSVSGFVIGGNAGLQRLRDDASVFLSRQRFEHADAPLEGPRPLDPDAARATGAPVLAAHCSPDLPDLIRSRSEGGYERVELASGELGTTGAVDVFVGEAIDRLPLEASGLDSLCGPLTPTKRLVHDLVIHEDLPLSAPEVRVLTDRTGTERWPEPDGPGTLPIDVRVVDLGTGLDGLALGDHPGYLDMARDAVQRMGWDAERMRAFRVAVEYPVQHSVLWVRAGRR